MTFNESFSLHSEKEKAIVETNYSVSDNIELEIESPPAQPSSLEVGEVKNINQNNNFDAPMRQQ